MSIPAKGFLSAGCFEPAQFSFFPAADLKITLSYRPLPHPPTRHIFEIMSRKWREKDTLPLSNEVNISKGGKIGQKVPASLMRAEF